MINKIEVSVNNERTMQLAQQGKDKEITLTTYNTKSGNVGIRSKTKGERNTKQI